MRCLLFFPLLLLLASIGPARATEELLQLDRFGTVTLYHESAHPAHLVLLVSGEEGWNQRVVDMAKALSSLDALVVGIDLRPYLQALGTSEGWCVYPGGDFEALSKFVQKKFDFPHYVLPILVGYNAGATLIYALLAQAPPNMFRGAISLGFCPTLLLAKPLCQWNELHWRQESQEKGYTFLPASHLQASWIVLQGSRDEVCDATAVGNYVKQVGQGTFVLMPQVDHEFSTPAQWILQFKQAFTDLVEKPEPSRALQVEMVRDLPLVEVLSTRPGRDTLAVILSGDGGWASIDRELGNTLASHGISVVGLNSLQYFWTRRTPDGAARDLERVLRHYLATWKKEKALLVGYSRGADVLPFMANRLPQDLLVRIQLVVLLGPGQTVDFEFHLTDWFADSSGKIARPVLPELEKLKGTRILCFYGEEEQETLCKNLDPTLARVIPLQGGHHFDGGYAALAETILQEAR